MPWGKKYSVLFGRRARAGGRTCVCAKGFAQCTGAGMVDVVPLQFREGAPRCSEEGEVSVGREHSVWLGQRGRAGGRTCACSKGFAHGTGMADVVPMRKNCTGTALGAGKRAYFSCLVSR